MTDSEEKRLNLPSGSFEVPLVIQDKRLNGKSLTYNPNKNDIMTGFMGKDIIVNGITSPFLNVSTGYYRLRVLNGSNARVYNLALSNNSKFTVIGTDGGLYVSIDKGNSFMLWNAGLPKSVPIHDIVIHQRENEIVLGTHGRSIYIAKLDDVQRLLKDSSFKMKMVKESELRTQVDSKGNDIK